VLSVVLLRSGQVLDELVREPGEDRAADPAAARCVHHRRPRPPTDLDRRLGRQRDDHPGADAHGEQRHRGRVVLRTQREGHADLVPVRLEALDRCPPALERDPGDIEERTAVLLGACQERKAEQRAADPPGGRLLTAKANPGPAQIHRGAPLQPRPSGPPRTEHRPCLRAAGALGDQGALPVEAGRLVTLVGVPVDGDDRGAARDRAAAADPPFEESQCPAVVILVVDLKLRRVHRPVVGELRPGPDRGSPPAAHAVYAQDADHRIDRVGIATRIFGDRPLPGLADHAMVGQMRLEAAVLRDTRQPLEPPAGDRWPDVAIGAPQGGCDPLDEECV
jgi:hypothetical protein